MTMNRIIHGHGSLPPPAGLMFVGEAPGHHEFLEGRPFAIEGASGIDQRDYCARAGIDIEDGCYLTNLVKEYTHGNPDPTPEQIKRWGPVLLSEIEAAHPTLRLIVAVGKFAVEWFLGDGENPVNMEKVHGVPHHWNQGDLYSLVLPVYHPAYGLHKSSMRAVIDYDYKQIPRVLSGEVALPVDEYLGREEYHDVSGEELWNMLFPPGESGLEMGYDVPSPSSIALDTEGSLSAPWSIQVSWEPGTGYVLRRTRDDFSVGISALQYAVDHGAEIIVHNRMFDDPMTCGYYTTNNPSSTIQHVTAMGLIVPDDQWFDTQYAAYLLREYRQGLDVLCYRHCGMKVGKFLDLISDHGQHSQIEYLQRIADAKLPSPGEPLTVIEYTVEGYPFVKETNKVGFYITDQNGEERTYSPLSPSTRAGGIIRDLKNDKRDKDGNKVNPSRRWHKPPTSKGQAEIFYQVLSDVTSQFGEMPIPTMDDIPLDEAVDYSARDPDAALRLAAKLKPLLVERGLL